MKKKKRGIEIKIKLSNRWLYTLIAMGILAIIGVGVYAYANPDTGVGHDRVDIQPCLNGQILQTSAAGAWSCVDMPGGAVEIDPTVLASVKDGVSWSEVSSKPAGFADGVDDVGTDTHGTLQCTGRSISQSTANCNWECRQYDEQCTSSVGMYGAGFQCATYRSEGALVCQCCKVV